MIQDYHVFSVTKTILKEKLHLLFFLCEEDLLVMYQFYNLLYIIQEYKTV